MLFTKYSFGKCQCFDLYAYCAVLTKADGKDIVKKSSARKGRYASTMSIEQAGGLTDLSRRMALILIPSLLPGIS